MHSLCFCDYSSLSQFLCCIFAFCPFYSPSLVYLVFYLFYIIFSTSQILDSNSCIFVLVSMNLLLLLSFGLFCGSFSDFLKKMLNHLGKNFFLSIWLNHYVSSKIMGLLLPNDTLYCRRNYRWCKTSKQVSPLCTVNRKLETRLRRTFA